MSCHGFEKLIRFDIFCFAYFFHRFTLICFKKDWFCDYFQKNFNGFLGLMT